MGQIGNPKEELSQDLKLAKQYSDYTDSPITSEWDWLRQDPQGYAEAMKLKASLTAPDKTAWEIQVGHLLQARKDELITDDELKKGMGVYIPPEKASEFDKKFELAKKLNLSDNEWKKFFGVFLGEEEGASKVKYFDTADECVAKTPKIEGMTVDPTFSAKGYYPNYVKEDVESKINNYLYTKNNMFGDVSNIGIIPTKIQEKISYGEPLTDEDKTLIRNNHNLQKSLLSESALAKVEALLKQIGIDLNEKPTPEVETDPYAGLKKNWWEFWEGAEGMSEDQLKEAVMKGNPKAIEEAKKRGYIK